MALVMTLCERIHVLDGGRTIATGTPRRDPRASGRATRLSRARRAAMSADAPLLSSRILSVAMGRSQAVRGVDLRSRARRSRRHRRTERRGQDLAPFGDRRHRRRRRPAASTFAGQPLARRCRSRTSCRHGIALVPEGRHIFASLTVLENLHARRDDPQGRGRRAAPTSTRFFETFPILGQRRSQPAGQLSGGEQQQLAIARALLSRPSS